MILSRPTSTGSERSMLDEIASIGQAPVWVPPKSPGKKNHMERRD